MTYTDIAILWAGLDPWHGDPANPDQIN